MPKQKIYSIAIVVCLFLLCTSFPFSLFIKNGLICSILSLSLISIYVVGIIIFIYKDNLAKPMFSKPHLLDLLFLPFFLAAFSNFFVCLFDKIPVSGTIDFTSDMLGYSRIIVGVIAEEITFRWVLAKEISNYKNKFLAIIFSSLIFGGMHLLNINSFASIPYCLVQSVYAFGLGVLLSLTYLYGRNYIYPVLLHLSFNVFNDEIVSSLYNYEWNLTFYIVNISIAVILILYGLLVYYIYNKKELNYAS